MSLSGCFKQNSLDANDDPYYQSISKHEMTSSNKNKENAIVVQNSQAQIQEEEMKIQDKKEKVNKKQNFYFEIFEEFLSQNQDEVLKNELLDSLNQKKKIITKIQDIKTLNKMNELKKESIHFLEQKKQAFQNIKGKTKEKKQIQKILDDFILTKSEIKKYRQQQQQSKRCCAKCENCQYCSQKFREVNDELQQLKSQTLSVLLPLVLQNKSKLFSI